MRGAIRAKILTGRTFFPSGNPLLSSGLCMAPSLAALPVLSAEAPWLCLARLLGAGRDSFIVEFTDKRTRDAYCSYAPPDGIVSASRDPSCLMMSKAQCCKFCQHRVASSATAIYCFLKSLCGISHAKERCTTPCMHSKVMAEPTWFAGHAAF